MKRRSRLLARRLKGTESTTLSSTADVASFLATDVVAAIKAGDSRAALTAVQLAVTALSRFDVGSESWEDLQARYQREAAKHNVLIIHVGAKARGGIAPNPEPRRPPITASIPDGSLSAGRQRASPVGRRDPACEGDVTE